MITAVEGQSRTRFTPVALPKAGPLPMALANQKTQSGMWPGVRGPHEANPRP